MFIELSEYIKRPQLYELSTNKFWDDEHISKGMLEAHLTADSDGATRNHKFVHSSVNWMSKKFPSREFPKLLDLGCGPGIYAELFSERGYEVTGIDASKRSVNYAISHAKDKDLKISYSYGNYLEMDYCQQFDMITLIWCDYGALCYDDRALLLKKIYKALKPNGIFIFDVFTNKKFDTLTENKDYEYCLQGGFWSEKQYLCLNTSYLYENQTALRQTVVITTEKVECYNIWEHYFTQPEIAKELGAANLKVEAFHSDIAGKEYMDESETLCLIARKIMEDQKHEKNKTR